MSRPDERPAGLDRQLPARVLIVDDEAPARNRLREQLSQLARELPFVVAGEVATAAQALALMDEVSVDIVLLDVSMPGVDGLGLARRLLDRPVPPQVIFTTAHAEHALEAFDVNAADYLLKPVRASRLLSALERANGRLGERRPEAAQPASLQHFTVTERGRIVRVSIADVVYLRAELKYITVRTRDAQYLLEASLVQLEQMLGERFVRVHRACLVARGALRGLKRADPDGVEGAGWSVLLDGVDEQLPVSRRQWSLVRELLSG